MLPSLKFFFCERKPVKGFLALLLLCAAGCAKKEPDSPRLNDTGIYWGGDYPKGINTSCEGNILTSELNSDDFLEGDIISAQDCNQGLDHQSKSETAFKYIKLDHQGRKLEKSAERWSCVLDEITGLLWEVKQAPDSKFGNRGLQDGDDLFTWYNSNGKLNGGAIGDWNQKMNQCTGYVSGQPTTYCNIEEYKNRVNRQGLCGISTWRVPSRIELDSLVHYGRTEPAIDIRFFPGTKNQFYWSLSPSAQHQTNAWAVNFQFGYSAAVPRNNARGLRLVANWGPVK